MLQRDRLLLVRADFHAGQYPCGLARQIDAPRRARERHAGTLQADRELAARMVRIVALVDVGDGFAPAVQELDGVVAPLDRRHAEDRAALFIDRDPGFAVGNVQVRIGPGHPADIAVDDLVPAEAFLLEVGLLLAQDQQPAQQVEVGVMDVLFRHRARRGGRAGGLRETAASGQACQQGNGQHGRANGSGWEVHRLLVPVRWLQRPDCRRGMAKSELSLLLG
ncbi:hypothetical protein C7415_104142 [Cupriavidus alkaliphilus]|nr:hypothetical protein C7415_104142 [Cupriavidus alkaliphilus]